MKNCLILILIFQVILFSCSKTDKTGKQAEIKDLKSSKRKVEQSLILSDFEGNEYKIEQFKGSVILLNFWTSWVVSAEAELKKLAQLSTEIKDKEFTIISISLDDPYSPRLQEFVNKIKNNLTFNVFISQNNSEMNKVFYEIPQKIPCYYIINKNFEIVNHFTDPLDIDQTKKLIKDYLNEK
ncbi:MAG TPA: TlpA disulfide reductase family protein [bacterium]|nr:TlpA disulfide reductase family protein [bacterium]